MASGIINLTSNNSKLESRIVWNSSSNGSTANTSNVYAELQARRPDGYTTKGTWNGSLYIHNEQQDYSVHNSIGTDWVTLKAFTKYNVPHNDNGTGSCHIWGNVTGPSGTSLSSAYAEVDTWITLDTIPRYLDINSFSIQSKTINNVSIKWSVSDTRDETQYSLNGGEWIYSNNYWESVSSDNKSGIFRIDNLSPNTTYRIKIRARRKDSGLWTESSEISFTTYDYAKLTSVPNVNIGSSHTITWTNPSGATTSLKLCKTDNSSIIDYGTVTGTSKSLTPTAATIYALTPNSNTYKARYILTTTQNSKTYTNYKDFTFTVTNSNPTFSNFTYKDTNATTVALTGNNQILVKGYSNVSATISTTNRAVAKNSATMKTYKLAIGNKSTNTKAYSSTADVTLDTINSINSGTIIVYATDSRGNSTSATKNATYKNYADLVIKSFTATRSNNGVGQAVTLKFSGTYWANSFGKVTNAITSVKYFYKVSSANSWQTGATTLTYTASNGNFSGSLSVQGDLGANGFDVSKSFNIRLQVTDKLVTKNYDITLGSGTPAIAIYKDNVAIGQKYDTSVNAKLQVAGGINIPNGSSTEPYNSYQIGGEPVIRNTGDGTIISGKGSIYLRPNGTTDATGQVSVDTNGNVGIKGNLDVSNKSFLRGGLYSYEVGNAENPIGNGTLIIKRVNNTEAPNNGVVLEYGNSKTWAGQLYIGDNATQGIYYNGWSNGNRGSWRRLADEPITLYDNTNGSNGTITLSQTSANFSYLEIFYTDNAGNQMQSIRVASPNGKTITLDCIEPNNSGQAYAYQRISSYSISGTSVTRKNSVYIQHNPSAVPNINTNVYIVIKKVLGWR